MLAWLPTQNREGKKKVKIENEDDDDDFLRSLTFLDALFIKYNTEEENQVFQLKWHSSNCWNWNIKYNQTIFFTRWFLEPFKRKRLSFEKEWFFGNSSYTIPALQFKKEFKKERANKYFFHFTQKEKKKNR